MEFNFGQDSMLRLVNHSEKSKLVKDEGNTQGLLL